MSITADPLRTGGSPGPDPQAYLRAQSTPEFGELRRRYRGFAFPVTIAFLVWYFAFVLAAVFAPGFMGTKVLGSINVGIVFGLLQFATTGLITWRYVRHASKRLDPLAREIREELEGGAR